jgi:hypothetical protein
MYYGSYDIETLDYLLGNNQAVEQSTQTALANVSAIAATGTTAQIVGFDASGTPAPKNVGGDANGAGLAFSGDILTASLPQDLKATGNPTFAGLNITNLAQIGSLRVNAGLTVKNITAGSLSIDLPNISGHTRLNVSVTITGIDVGDVVFLEPPTTLDNALIFGGCSVASANTLNVYIGNLSNGNVNDGAHTWRYVWVDLT